MPTFNIANIVRSEHEDNHIGRCYESPTGNLRYIPIAKCGSTAGEQWCNQHNWKRVNFLQNPSQCDYLVILRHPWSRWISAIDMFVRWRKGLNKTWQTITKDHLEVIATTVIMDQHSEKQSTYLHGISSEQIKFCHFNDTLDQQWQTHTGSVLQKVHWNPTSEQPVPGNELKNYNKDWFESLQSNTAWYEKFKRIYRSDFELWKDSGADAHP